MKTKNHEILIHTQDKQEKKIVHEKTSFLIALTDFSNSNMFINSLKRKKKFFFSMQTEAFLLESQFHFITSTHIK